VGDQRLCPLQQLRATCLCRIAPSGRQPSSGHKFLASVESSNGRSKTVYAPISGTVEVATKAVLASPGGRSRTTPSGEGGCCCGVPVRRPKLNDLMVPSGSRA